MLGEVFKRARAIIQKMLIALERYFEFKRLGTNWKTEILAGATTFVTMAYIVFVNPSILRETGMPFEAVVAATCLCAGVRQHFDGRVGALPDRARAGMGLNAYSPTRWSREWEFRGRRRWARCFSRASRS